MNLPNAEKTAVYCNMLAHQNLKEERRAIVKSYPMKISVNRRVAYYRFDPPIPLSGDIKISIKAKILPMDRVSFVWFNTNFITDRVTIFSVDEVDLSKSSSSSSSSSSSLSSSSSSSLSSSSSSSVRSIGESETVYGIAADGSEQRFQIRCQFADDELVETAESSKLKKELENIHEEEVIQVSSSRGKGLIQKAQSLTYLFRGSSTSSSTLYRASPMPEPSSRCSPAPSVDDLVSGKISRANSGPLTSESAPMMLEMETKSKSVNNIIGTELTMRDHSSVALRQKMRMTSLHESEEFMQSINSGPAKEEGKGIEDRVSSEASSDEIHLDSDSPTK